MTEKKKTKLAITVAVPSSQSRTLKACDYCRGTELTEWETESLRLLSQHRVHRVGPWFFRVPGQL